MPSENDNIHSAKQLADQKSEKSEARKIADRAGQVSSAKHLARLSEVLDGEATVSVEEVAKLFDETMPNEPVGIALAIEYQIQDRQSNVKKLAALVASNCLLLWGKNFPTEASGLSSRYN